jgi:hypothetical protein
VIVPQQTECLLHFTSQRHRSPAGVCIGTSFSGVVQIKHPTLVNICSRVVPETRHKTQRRRPLKLTHNNHHRIFSSKMSNSTLTQSSPNISLLRISPSVTMYGTTTTSQRPLLQHAQTTVGTQETPTATPSLSRPLLPRATTTSAVLRPTAQRTTSQPVTRPGFFRRISAHIDTALELSTAASYAHRNRPAQPSHWTDHAHREALLKTWDSVHEAAVNSKSKYPSSINGQLVATEKSVMLQFPELAQGEVVLGRQWMEYVLGVNLRHPFCAEGKMGRWEVLSGVGKVGGVRAWGPW